ncbi:MAG: phosphoribosyltransferase family protein [Pirellulales bacterium]
MGHYRGRLREAVILCKKIRCEHLRYALAEQLANQLLKRFPNEATMLPLIIPVPYHWTRTFASTAAWAHSLAELLGYHTGWPVSPRLVRRVRRTAKQGMLSLTERKQNVRGAFQMSKKASVAGRHIFIVDDVVTSGATVDELAKQLRPAKPAQITVVAIARATGT